MLFRSYSMLLCFQTVNFCQNVWRNESRQRATHRSNTTFRWLTSQFPSAEFAIRKTTTVTLHMHLNPHTNSPSDTFSSFICYTFLAQCISFTTSSLGVGNSPPHVTLGQVAPPLLLHTAVPGRRAPLNLPSYFTTAYNPFIATPSACSGSWPD